MPFMRWTVSDEENGLALRDWLVRRLPNAPTGYLGQLLRSGRIRRDHLALDRDAVLSSGESIELPDSQRLIRLAEGNPKIAILQQTEHWVIAGKPAGLAVHRSAQHPDNLTDRVQQLFSRQQVPFRVAPVQRLDIGTSGPVLFAKGRKASSKLGKLIMARGMKKYYLALVDGQLNDSGHLQTTLLIDGKPKVAASRFRTLCRWSDCSLLLVTIKTGRKHQIRRQLAAAGHPIAGDTRYRSRLSTPAERFFLHQCRIRFFDPWLQRDIKISSPLPEELRDWLYSLEQGRKTDKSVETDMLV